MFGEFWWIYFCVVFPAFGATCSIIAYNKCRSSVGWFFLGYLFGVIAIIIVACLSNKTDVYYDRLSEAYPVPHKKQELDLLEEIGRYKKLYEDGIISEDKYNSERCRIQSEINNFNNQS